MPDNINKIPHSKSGSDQTLRAILLYLVFCFFYLGVVVMIHFVYYKLLASVDQHFLSFMAVFNSRMIWICCLPAILMLLSSIYLMLNKPCAIARWMVWFSIILAAINVIVNLFIIMPAHADLGATGFNHVLYNKLLLVSAIGQILLAVLLSLIALLMLNAYFDDTKPTARFVFLLLFLAVFYSAGADAVEKYIGYPSWLTIGNADWMATRSAINSSGFFSLYLLPSYLPLVVVITMFWLRPKGIPRYFIVILLVCLCYILAITAAYFVPHLQIKLNTTFSKPLIEELIRNDFPLRGIAELIFFFTVAAIFVKSRQTASGGL